MLSNPGMKMARRLSDISSVTARATKFINNHGLEQMRNGILEPEQVSKLERGHKYNTQLSHWKDIIDEARELVTHDCALLTRKRKNEKYIFSGNCMYN